MTALRGSGGHHKLRGQAVRAIQVLTDAVEGHLWVTRGGTWPSMSA